MYNKIYQILDEKAGQKLEFFWMDHIWERSAF